MLKALEVIFSLWEDPEQTADLAASTSNCAEVRISELDPGFFERIKMCNTLSASVSEHHPQAP